MKKLLIIISIIFLSFISTNLFVDAKDTAGLSTDTDPSQYNKMKAEFDKENSSLSKVNIDYASMVTIYGKSECNGTSCSIMYAGQYSNYKDVLKRKVVCTNGEKYIEITSASGIGQYDTDNKAQLNGIAYWNEDFYVTCTSNGTGELLQNNDSNNGDVNNGTNNGNVNNGTNNGLTNNGTTNGTNNGTVENPQTGVTEYFVVLGIIALLSYVCMIFVKKLNLFKKV